MRNPPAAEREEHRIAVLLATLELAVPLHLHEIRGKSDAWRMGEARRCADMVASHGDDLQYGGKHCAAAFNAVARGVALGAMQPGGITLHGRHWCTDHDACLAAELRAQQMTDGQGPGDE